MAQIDWQEVYSWSRRFASRKPRRAGPESVLCSSRIALVGFVFLMSFAVAAVAEESRPVERLEVGPCTVLVARQPFRFSILEGDRLRVAQRYRRWQSSLEYFDVDGWHGVGELVEFEPIRQPESDPKRPPDSWTLTMKDGAREIRVRIGWQATARLLVFEVERVDSAGAVKEEAESREPPPERSSPKRSAETDAPAQPADSGVEAGVGPIWRLDIVRYYNERLVGVLPGAFPVLLVARPDAPGGVNSAVAPGDGDATGTGKATALVFSSRGFGWIVAGDRQRPVAFAPDPDAYRLQARGRKLTVAWAPGTPRQVARAERVWRSGRAEDEPGDFPWQAVHGRTSLPPAIVQGLPRVLREKPLWPFFALHPEIDWAWTDTSILGPNPEHLLVVAPSSAARRPDAPTAEPTTAALRLPNGRWREAASGRTIHGGRLVELPVSSSGFTLLERVPATRGGESDE